MTANTSGDGVRRYCMAHLTDAGLVSMYDPAKVSGATSYAHAETQFVLASDYDAAISRVAALEAKLRQMVMHGDRCNWFTDEDERNVVAAARALLSPNEAK